jgi:8-oxo-dGTP pyrophosphatase MutT (NUDIX family)
MLNEVDNEYLRQAGDADKWVSSIFVVCGRDVLAVRTFRFPGYWQPIGGQAIPSDGSPAETAIRELYEETGVHANIDELENLGSQPRDRGSGRVFAWRYSTSSRFVPRVPANEIAEYRWVRLLELLRLPTFAATHHFASRLVSDSTPRLGGWKPP